MEDRKAEVELAEAQACPTWLYANAGASGYYRTLPVGMPRDLTAAERLTMALDMPALVASGNVSASQALDVMPELARDSEPQVAQAAAGFVCALAVIAARSPYW